MMLFHGFKTKKALRDAIKTRIVRFDVHNEETSIFGAEYKGAGRYCVCMDHPNRTKFANITVDEIGNITRVD